MRTTAMGWLVLCVLLGCLPMAWGAEVAPAPDSAARVAWIQKALDDQAGASRLWQYGWTGVYGAATVVEGAKAANKDGADEEDERFDSTVNAVTSLLGFGSMLFDPLTLHGDAKRLAAMPQDTDEEIKAKLAMAELSLRKAAEREERGRSLETHLIAGAVNLAAGLVVTLDGGREGDGLAIFATGMLLSEAQIFTTPQRAIATWDAYRKGSLGSIAQIHRHRDDRFRLAVAPGYVAATWLF